MASTVPAKSKPLHNFSLPHLKWRRNQSGNHHGGRSRLADSSPHRSPSSDTSAQQRHSPKHCSTSTPRASPLRDSTSTIQQTPGHNYNYSPLRQSPMDESAVDSNSSYAIPSRNKFVTENLKDSEPNSVKICTHNSSTDRTVERFGVKLKVSATDAGALKDKELRSNSTCMRLSKNKIDEVEDDERKTDDLQDHEANIVTVEGAGDAQESTIPKKWNFRPRKPLYKPNNSANGGGGATKVGGSLFQEMAKTQTQPQAANHTKKSESEANINGADQGNNQKKHKFSISLSKQEIEEDFFAMTGSKPSRRPKKRPRTVRRTLDNLFPGLWLAWITPDSYKGSDDNPAGKV